MVNSASASHERLSTAGSASLSGFAILANPRVIPSSKTIVVDAQLFIGPEDDNFILGSLRYFNSDDKTFVDEPMLYLIHATVSLFKLPVFIAIN
jgi:hypothetical protein